MDEISSDGTYDIRQCYEIIRIKRAVPLTLLRKGAIFKNEVIHRIERSITSISTAHISIEK
ncbi:hypothetical protein [Candidatus Enterovibrio altilux]|uniref:hypothetical protein n=1 Tax=Candidatus Enterovibrio altilux TaxID=1927128 RepID=UPI000BBCEE79|nr:hypothetical protein [Candidatus Enterovibrio luxaltus]